MSLNRTLYLSYTALDGFTPYFRRLPGERALNEIGEGARRMKTVATRLKMHSPSPTDTPIDVVCVTNARFDQTETERINLLAINWLMNTGMIGKGSGLE